MWEEFLVSVLSDARRVAGQSQQSRGGTPLTDALEYRKKLERELREYEDHEALERLLKVDVPTLFVRNDLLLGVELTNLCGNVSFRVLEAAKSGDDLYFRSELRFDMPDQSPDGTSNIVWDRELIVLRPRSDYVIIQSSVPSREHRSDACAALSEWFIQLRIIP